MRLRSVSFLIFSIVSLAAIFWLPLHVPMQPNLSISYICGFHNRTALIATLISLVIGAFTLRGIDLHLPDTEDAVPPRSILWKGMLATTCLCAFTFLVAYPTGGIDEAPYLLTRLHVLMTGAHPYVNFEFLYGPLLLYIPLALVRGLHLSAFSAYFLAWYLMWIAGTAMEFFIIRALRFPAYTQKTAFWLLWAVFVAFNLNAGSTYTPLRQLAVLAAMLAYQRLHDTQNNFKPVVFAFCVQAFLFTLSPELPFAFTTAVTVYSATAALWNKDAKASKSAALGHLALILAGFAAIAWTATHLHELDSAREFGGGGADLPPLLTPMTFALLACLLLAATFCVQCLRARAVHGPAVAATLAAFSLLPGAFGRSDPPHLVVYLLGALLVVLLLAARSQRTWRVAAVVFFLLAPLHLLLSKLTLNHLMFYQAAVSYTFPQGRTDLWPGRVIVPLVEHRLGHTALNKLLLRTRVGPIDPAPLFPEATPVLQAPFGYYVRGNNSVRPSNVELGYLDGLNDVMGSKQIDRKIRELQSHPERDLLLPAGFQPDQACTVSLSTADGLMRALYGYNYLRGRNHPVMLMPLCQYIGEHYQFKANANNPLSLYELWTRT